VSDDALHGFVSFLPFGVILTAADGRVLHANPLAGHLIARRQPVWVDADGRLTGASPRETRRLRDAIRAVAEGRLKRAPLPATAGQRTLPMVVRGLPGRPPAGGGAAVCIADPRATPRDNVLAELHDLTPAQARLAVELLRGHGLTAAARRLEISTNTAKSQLQRLFAKTGASRQSDLVRLLMDPVAYL
jgi:DNA-binding CsgD family transcriptional regulator